MAFVYRKQDKQNQNHRTPGPGSYFKKPINQSQKISSAPFNNSSNREIWTKNNMPGPGAYQTYADINKQKKIIGSQFDEMIVYQSPKQSVEFKSKTFRFAQNKPSNSPGPGDYYIEQKTYDKSSNLQKKSTFNQSHTKFKQFLKSKNKQSHCIPNENQILRQMIISASGNEELQNQQTSFHQIFDERPLSGNKKSKNSVFFASKVKRELSKQRPKTSVGPGSYNLERPMISKEFHPHPQPQSKSISIYKTKVKTLTKVNSTDEDIGPGYYQVDQTFKVLNKQNKFKQKKIECFGSTVDRFTKFKTSAPSPGPASYQLIRTDPQNKKNPKLFHTGFSKQKREIFNQNKNSNLSPGCYNTINDVSFLFIQFSSILKDKYKSRVKGNFGSSQERFSDVKKQTVDNEAYIEQLYQPKPAVLSKNTFKRLGLKRKNLSQTNIVICQQDFKPLCYDSSFDTLGHRYSRKTQIDAPFLSGARRFQESKSKVQPELIKPSQNKTIRDKDKEKEKEKAQSMRGGSMKFTDPRFKYVKQKSEVLGPQYYNPAGLHKRSYNILFTNKD